MKNYCIKTLTLCMGIVFLSACSSNDPGPEASVASPKTLVSSQSVVTWGPGDLKGFLSAGGITLDIDLDAAQYNVQVNKITYMTDYKGDSVEASALVLIPMVDEGVAVPTISFQHGTIASDAEAPTNLSQTNAQIILLNLLATTGVTVVVPDFIGFGSSVEVMHPYYVEDVTATSIVNAIYASRQVVEDQEIEMSNELFLAGYSQGGYATMAAHKYYEVEGMDYYEMQASFPSSGGYDIKSFQEYFFDLETYHQPFFMAYVANAYVDNLGVGSLLDFFNEPYASAIPEYFDGSLNGSDINSLLNDTIDVLVNNELLANIDTDAKFSAIRNAFIDNSPINFVPQIPMFMFHGNADVTVPYENSVEVYNHFIESGASADVVTFTVIEGGTHYSGFGPYILSLYTQLQELKN